MIPRRLIRFTLINLYVLCTIMFLSCSNQEMSRVDIKNYCGKAYIGVTTGTNLFLSPLKSYLLDVDEGEVSSKKSPLEGDEVEWSPDGKWIVFSTLHTEGSQAGGNSEIYLMSSDGDRVVRVSTNTGDDHHPTWSPDNHKVAFVSGNKIQILDIECFKDSDICDNKPHEIAQGSYPAWSPDGELISYSQDGDIYLVQSDGAGEKNKLTSDLYCYQTNWSPDGTRIIMGCNGDIYQINSDGTGFANLTNGIGNNTTPLWSSDGSKIFFVSNWDDGNLGKTLDLDGSVISNALFVMNAGGSEVTRVSPNDDEYILWYAWTPECVNIE